MPDYSKRTDPRLLSDLQSDSQSDLWFDFCQLYEPFIRSWLGRFQLGEQDIDDLSQEVLTVVVRKIGEFQHQGRAGSFRSWLRKVTTNCTRDYWKSRRRKLSVTIEREFLEMLEQLEDDSSRLSGHWDQEHYEFVLKSLLEQVRSRFNEKTIRAFQMFAIEQIPIKQVAATLDVTESAISLAKTRVLDAMQQLTGDVFEL